MATLLKGYPGARRALFAAYHIGGCQSCAYREDETLAEVCQRNEIEVTDALRTLSESQTRDQAMLLSPSELQSRLASDDPPLILDIRTREEFEAVSLPGSVFMTQEKQTELFAGNQKRAIVLVDHSGRSVLDQCAWFQGHGLSETRGLDGGIDRWAQDIDSSIPRYRLELE